MGTNTLFFAIINLLKLPGSLAAGVVEPSALAWSMAFCPLVAIGVFLGRYVIARIDAKVFDHIMTVVLVIACAWLIATAFHLTSASALGLRPSKPLTDRRRRRRSSVGLTRLAQAVRR